MAEKKKAPEPQKKSKILTLEEFQKKISAADKAAIVDLNTKKPMDFIPTGSWVIDTLIGDGTMTGTPGGFPRGHIVEVFGDESSGKTTLALSICREAQELGGLPVFMDFEQTFHPGYAEKMGINLAKNKFLVFQPNHFQHGARLIKDSLSMKPLVIVCDSVSAMLPQQFLEGAIDDATRIGLQAQLMSGMLSYITKYLKESNTCLVFTNQLRSVIKKSKYEGGPDEESSGGRALKFYSSVRLKLKKSTVEKIDVKSKITGKKGQEPVNVIIKATVVKNKIDKPYYTAPVYIRFGKGFDNILSIIELAVNTNTIKKSGAFFTFEKNDKSIIKAQGKEQLWRMMDEDDKLCEAIQEKLTIVQDKEAKEEYVQFNENVEAGDEMEDMMTNIADNYIEKEKDKKIKKENDE